MNGKKAKKLRKIAYGDKPTNLAGRKYRRTSTGAVVCIDDRTTYQDLKKG